MRPAALAAFALLALLPGAWSPSQITRGDVTMYVLMYVVGIIQTGNPWLLHFDQGLDFSKPPLFHWLIVGAIKLLPNAFLAARLPPILCSAGCVLLTCALGRTLGLDRRRASLAALLLLSMIGLFNYGRQPLLEAPMMLAIAAAVYGFARACVDRRPAWLLLLGAATGASAMVKWAIGPATIVIFCGAYVFWSGRWTWLSRQWMWLLGALLAGAAIALPYPVAMALSHPQSFYTQMFIQLFRDRYLERTTIAQYLSSSLLVNPLPWTPLVAVAAWRWRRLGAETRALLGSWVLAVVGPTLLISSRTDRYAYPALPALALMAAAAFDEKKVEWRTAAKLCAFGVALGVGVSSMALCYLNLLAWPLALAGLVCAAAAVWGDLSVCAGAAALGLMLALGVAYANAGVNVIPAEALSAIGERSVARFDNSPDAQSTGYLQLYLMRQVPILGATNVLEPGLVVVAESGLEFLKSTAARDGLVCEPVLSWTNYNTNPRAAGLKALQALRTRSLAPIEVRQHLVELRRRA